MKKLHIVIGISALVFIVTSVFFQLHVNTVKQQINKTTAVPMKSYLALGDSVAAGVGLATDSDSSACNRTDESYPQQVAKILDLRLLNLACSGATLTVGITGPQTVNKLLLAPQLDRLFADKQPDLISLTVGANDADWTTVIAACYISVCGSDADKAVVQAKLVVMANNLGAALSRIGVRYSPNHRGVNRPRIVVTGYHQVVPAAPISNCPDLAGIDSNEQSYIRQLQSDLSSTTKSVVSRYSFAQFADADFSGHELCTKDPWVQGLRDKQPYHPTAAGQIAYAAQIIKQVGLKK